MISMSGGVGINRRDDLTAKQCLQQQVYSGINSHFLCFKFMNHDHRLVKRNASTVTPIPIRCRKHLPSAAAAISLCSSEGKLKRNASISAPIPSRYRRPLPSPAISLYSNDGKRLLDEAKALGTAAGFLEIATNLVTQKELTYCGLSSVITILNALLIDPEHVWKGPWRWYDESMLVECETREKLDTKGLSFEDLVYLVPKDKVKLQADYATDSSLQEFRAHVLESCSSDSSYMLANFSRPMLQQAGKGHYSPIAAYNPKADVALLLDVARFKYPPHWVPLVNLWEAIAAKTNAPSGKSRGFMIISKP